MKSVRIWIAIAVASGLLAGCGGGGGGSTVTTPAPVDAVAQFMNQVIAAVTSSSNREPDDISAVTVGVSETSEPVDISLVAVGA